MVDKKKKRSYTKRNTEYWQNKSLGMSQSKSENSQEFNFEPEFAGEPLITFDQSLGSRLSAPTGRTSSRTNRAAKKPTKKRFENIEEGLLPYEYSGDHVSVKDAVVLTQKAYFNVPVFASTINLLSEFANTKIYIDKKTGNESSRKFIESWFKLIKINDLKEQCFREYFRSGNLFPYAVAAGKLGPKNVKRFSLANVGAEIPIKYIILNPADIIVNGQLSFGEYTFAKALTPFEIARLKESKTPEAKEMFEKLPDKIKEQLKGEQMGSTKKEIHVPLEADLIRPVFYKKQDYEPLAIPMGFAVLDDINKKIELKKVDQAITRSIENVVLLITMGAEKEKGGVNYKHLAAMQELFKNQSVGRVLVSDYTTKGEFLIPDLRKVTGKEKYEVLNKDIEEGLGNILLGESKYADTELKLKIFFERLEEARDRVLSDFLQPEIEKVCKAVGFRDIPVAKFTKKDTITSSDLQRLVTRMMELGIVTPEQGMDVINDGLFPESENMEDAQEKYLEQREKGYYQPIVNSNLFIEEEGEEVDTETDDKENNKQRDGQLKPKGHRQKNTVNSPSGGRPTGTASTYSVANISKVVDRIGDLEKDAQSIYRKKLGLKRLSKEKKNVITELCCSVASSFDMQDWESKIKEVIDDNSILLKLSVKDDILKMGAEHGLDDHSAAILYHSTKID